MRTTLSAGVLVAVLSAVTVNAQDLTGDWQGTATRSIRLLVHIEKADDAWKATFANIDQGTDRGHVTPATSVNVNGEDFRFTLADGRSYDDTISTDGNAIVGTLHIGRDLPLTLNPATPPTSGSTHRRTRGSLLPSNRA